MKTLRGATILKVANACLCELAFRRGESKNAGTWGPRRDRLKARPISSLKCRLPRLRSGRTEHGAV